MTPTDIREIITAITAILAFALSLFNFVIDRRDKSSKIKVILANGTIKTGRKIQPYNNGYFVEVINNGQARVVITSVTIGFAQKHRTIIEATAKKINVDAPAMRSEENDDLQYYFEKAILTEEYKSALSGGENVYYWFSKDETKYVTENNLTFDLIDQNLGIQIRAKVSIALGKQYYSNTINISPSNKTKKRRNS